MSFLSNNSVKDRTSI